MALSQAPGTPLPLSEHVTRCKTDWLYSPRNYTVPSTSCHRDLLLSPPFMTNWQVLTDRLYSRDQLDTLSLPNLTFTFRNSSGPVNFLPSQYLLYDSYLGKRDGRYRYTVPVMSASAMGFTNGILGM